MKACDADCIVAEVNQGGELVAQMLRQVSPGVPVRMVRATRGKFLRAEPVAALYERGLVAHVGMWPELEDQMCDFGPGGLSNGASPDRLDALVWALTELMLNEQGGAAGGSLEPFPFRLDRNGALSPCLVAFSRRKPVSTLLENAPEHDGARQK